jgi:proteic killer suppression protein
MGDEAEGRSGGSGRSSYPIPPTRVIEPPRLDGLHANRVACSRSVIQSFSDETTAELFRDRNTRAARRIPRDLWRVVQRKLKLLDGAARLDDLAIPSGNRLERLKGRQGERYSIRVNDQYRVTFRWENGHAYEVCVEDYH